VVVLAKGTGVKKVVRHSSVRPARR
jgi:hypothetical protein